MPERDQVNRMKIAALEAMKDDEQDFIFYLRQSLQNMKSAASSINSPINIAGVYEMMKVLKEDLIKKYPRKIVACIQNADKREDLIYQNLQIFVGTYRVWISKSGTQIYVCVGG